MLENIGFYTLTDERAKNTSETSPMWRCEMILTPRCNFACTYCRGLSVLSEDCSEDIDYSTAEFTLSQWINQGLRNVRFSGGEPTLYPHLVELVYQCRRGGVSRIAISTNGSMDFGVYEKLIEAGVNDFSISLDACCATFGDKMAGVNGSWNKVVGNIRKISALTYVTVGVVLTEENVDTVSDIVCFAHSLGVADIRIISAAQYNDVLFGLDKIPQEVLDAHPILAYRVRNFKNGRNVRGIDKDDCRRCHLVKDDSVVAGKWHYPCVIYMREGGHAIGEVSPDMRRERIKWFETHDSFIDPICRGNCLDVCLDYNSAAENR